MLESYLAIPPLLGVLGLLVALGIYIVVTRFSEGEENVKKIGDQIHLGAMTFMKTEYTYLSIFALVVIVLVWFSLGEGTAIAVLAGALSSSIAGWIGMYSATKANVRTATAASEAGAEVAKKSIQVSVEVGQPFGSINPFGSIGSSFGNIMAQVTSQNSSAVGKFTDTLTNRHCSTINLVEEEDTSLGTGSHKPIGWVESGGFDTIDNHITIIG